MRLVPKLTIGLFTVLVAVLATQGVRSARREAALFEAEKRNDARLLGDALAPAVSLTWRTQGLEPALGLIRAADDREKELRLRWVALDARPGDPHAPDVPPRGLAEVVRGESASRTGRDELGRDRLYFYVPLAVTSGTPAALEVSKSLAPIHGFERRVAIDGAVVATATAALGALVAAVMGFWFVGRPVGALVEKARRIGSGDFAGPIVITQRDELGRLAREMNEMADRLGSALEQLRRADRLATVGTLAAGIAHELGTPLNVVAGHAKMIVSGEVVATEAARSAGVIVAQAERMTVIIRQLLDFARRATPRKARGTLGQLVADIAALVAPLAARREVRIALERGEEPSVEFDPGQLQQALMNLVVNGLHAMSSGGSLTIATGRARGHVETATVSVRDGGEGIPAEDHARVFEPFFTTKGPGEGTGLGLAVAWGIVREHGGWIAVESEPGRGSLFTIHLPLEGGPTCPAS